MTEQEINQQKLFKYLGEKYGDSRVIVNELQDILHIKKGAAYKRMSGETALTLTELIQISEHFRVSLDTIFQKNRFFSFRHPFKQQDEESPAKFLEQFNKILNPLKYDKGNKKHLYYLTNEIPIFYYLMHKYIFSFLMNVWAHLHWDTHKLSIDQSNIYDKQAEIFREEIVNNYYSNQVTEIWNSNMMNNLYQQVIFCITIRAFKEASFIDRLIEDIQSLLNHLRTISVEGIKSVKGAKLEGSELKIYLNDFGTYLNMVLLESQNFNSTFIGYDFPQFIMSDHIEFTNFSKEWIQKIMKRSVLISSEGYQYRELFFIKMENDFEYFKTRVEKLRGIYYA